MRGYRLRVQLVAGIGGMKEIRELRERERHLMTIDNWGQGRFGEFQTACKGIIGQGIRKT